MTPPPLSELGARVLRNRRLMRAPIRLYRLGLGFVFGSRLLMLEHIGRKSGKYRHVVLEVIGHPAPSTYVVVSGFGAKAQWYRNILANQSVRITVGLHGPRAATARILATEDADAALNAYASRHPRAWETFKPVIESTLGRPIHETGTELPIIAFDLEDQ